MSGPSSAITLFDCCEISWSCASVSLPAPGSSRSITYLAIGVPPPHGRIPSVWTDPYQWSGSMRTEGMEVKAQVRNQRIVKGEETRGALLAAARELFGAAGYGGTSLDEVAVRAGVTKGALYHHF